ncbi:MAG: hypothetical protein WC637_07215 [Victivallales bacterium]|jgi:hypothetical protein
MEVNNLGKKLAGVYLRKAGLIGALYGIIPVILWFSVMFILIPFREVYLLRFALSLVIAGASGAYFNRYGLTLWLTKHNSKLGPATVVDGMIIGASIGFGTALITPLTSLIASHHVEEAKWFIIFSWLLAVSIGFLWGGLVTAIGGKYIDRQTCLDKEVPK